MGQQQDQPSELGRTALPRLRGAVRRHCVQDEAGGLLGQPRGAGMAAPYVGLAGAGLNTPGSVLGEPRLIGRYSG